MSAYAQRHSRDFAGPYAERGDRYLCPCRCGRVLSREWFTAIAGMSPEEYRPPTERFRDPSDEPTYNREQRSA